MGDEFKKSILKEGKSIIDAIKIIDESNQQIVLVVDENGRLTGTITDGDIRRGILAGVSLTDSIDTIVNTSPYTVSEGTSKDEQLLIMTDKKIHQLPVVNEQGKVVDLLHLDILAKEKSDTIDYGDVSVVLMLGGLGSRLAPLTENLPKPMMPIGDRPLLEIIIENFTRQGFKNFYFSVNYKAEIIEDHFGDGSNFGANITYLHENKPMGTAGALSLIPEQPEGHLIVMNGDILTNNNFRHLIDFHHQNHSVATMCVREYHQQVPYGVVETKGTKLQSIIEKPSQTYFVNAGIYIINPEVLDYVPENKSVDMPELFEKLEQSGIDLAVFPIREYWIDIGNAEDLKQAQADYNSVFSRQDTQKTS